jgi:hypothetical protein
LRNASISTRSGDLGSVKNCAGKKMTAPVTPRASVFGICPAFFLTYGDDRTFIGNKFAVDASTIKLGIGNVGGGNRVRVAPGACPLASEAHKWRQGKNQASVQTMQTCFEYHLKLLKIDTGKHSGKYG